MTLRITRFDQLVPLVDPVSGKLTMEGQRRIQRMMEEIEGAVNGLTDALATIVDLNDLITTQGTDLTALADAAQAAADNANAAAASLAGQTSLQSSYPSGATIGATDVGASVTVTISAHNRIYPQADGSNVTVAVNGGSITGLAYSTDYWIYYDDPTRAGGAVTYVATTSETTGAQIGDRHAVGGVTTPAAAAPPATGKITKAAGIVDLR